MNVLPGGGGWLLLFCWFVAAVLDRNIILLPGTVGREGVVLLLLLSPPRGVVLGVVATELPELWEGWLEMLRVLVYCNASIAFVERWLVVVRRSGWY